MKSEKGLTFFSTIILVIIIALIAFIVVYFTRMQIGKEKTEDDKIYMLSVKAKITSISGTYKVDKKDEKLVGTKLSEMKEDSIVKEFLEKELFNPDEKNKKYYVLNQQNLNDLGLGKIILEDAYYIVEYTSGEVYYTKGYTNENGEVHYKVTELEDEVKKSQEEKQNAE